MTGCHSFFHRVCVYSWHGRWLVSSVVILLSDSSLLCHVLTVHNCLFCNSAYLTENINCSLGRQGVTRVRAYVQGDKIKLLFNLIYRVSIVTVFRCAVCSLHKYTDSILCHNLHHSSRSAAFAAIQICRESGFSRRSVYC